MPGQQQIVVQFLEVFEFEPEQAVIPCRPLRRLVGHDAERLHLRVRQVVREGNGHLGQAEHEGRFQPQMPVNDVAVGLGDNGDAKPEFPDARRHPLDLFVILARVPGVGNQTLHRPHFNSQIHFDNSEKSF